MKKNIQIIAVLLLLSHHALFGQGFGHAARVTTHIELQQDTILLGEPMYFNYVINNISDDVIYVKEGGDYRCGRPETFNVLALTEKNDTVDRREWFTVYGGGMVGFRKILPKQSRKFELFLTSWVEIQKPGTYKLLASKNFHIAFENPFATEDVSYENVEIVPKEASTMLVVVEDYAGLGVFVDALVKEVKDRTDEQSADEKANRVVNESLGKKIKMIEDINDSRIIPFLVESYQENRYIRPSMAIRLLSKFSQEASAFETLQRAAQSAEPSRCFVSEDSIGFAVGGDDVRPIAIDGIMKRDDQKALDFLIAKKDDTYPCERMTMLIRAPRVLSKSNRKILYKAYMTDQHKVVRLVAREAYEAMLKEE